MELKQVCLQKETVVFEDTNLVSYDDSENSALLAGVNTWLKK